MICTVLLKFIVFLCVFSCFFFFLLPGRGRHPGSEGVWGSAVCSSDLGVGGRGGGGGAGRLLLLLHLSGAVAFGAV